QLFFCGLFLVSVSCIFAGGGREDSASRVTLALSGNPSTLDPHATTETLTFQATKSLYDTLLEPDIDGSLVPALAVSWEIAQDNLSIDFQLRSGVVFHDGTAFDAEDVKASLERNIDPDFASPNFGDFEPISGVEVLGPLEVRIRL